MNISIKLPDEVGERLSHRWRDLPRHALEVLVAAAYRDGELTTAEVQSILDLPSRFDTDAFLGRAGVDLDYTWEDLEEDMETLRKTSPR